MQQDGPLGQLLDFRTEQVDEQLVLGQFLGGLAVAAHQGIGGPGQVRGDQAEQFDDLGIDGIQLTLKALPLLGHSQSLLGKTAQTHEPMAPRASAGRAPQARGTEQGTSQAEHPGGHEGNCCSRVLADHTADPGTGGQARGDGGSGAGERSRIRPRLGRRAAPESRPRKSPPLPNWFISERIGSVKLGRITVSDPLDQPERSCCWQYEQFSIAGSMSPPAVASAQAGHCRCPGGHRREDARGTGVS